MSREFGGRSIQHYEKKPEPQHVLVQKKRKEDILSITIYLQERISNRYLDNPFSSIKTWT